MMQKEKINLNLNNKKVAFLQCDICICVKMLMPNQQYNFFVQNKAFKKATKQASKSIQTNITLWKDYTFNEDD